MSRSLFIFLIFYTLFSSEGICQNLALKIIGETESETKVIDSLSYLETHPDFKSIKHEVNSLQKKLFQIGYIENKIDNLKRENDSTYLAKFKIKKSYKKDIKRKLNYYQKG